MGRHRPRQRWNRRRYASRKTEMASTNLIHRFENKLEAPNAKLDAQNAILAARNEALDSRLRFVQWAIGLGVAYTTSVMMRV